MKKNFLLFIFAAFGILSVYSQQIPAFDLKSIDGKTVNTAKIENDGKPIIISFWATWCKPCLRELNTIHEEYIDWQEETGVKLIAISVDKAQDANRVKTTVDRLSWDYEVLLDPNADFARSLNISPEMVPALLIIDGEGNIVEKRIGFVDGSAEHIIEKLRDIIDE